MNTPRRLPATRRTAGLSLVEMLCLVCILGVLLGGAIPSMREAHTRQVLLGVAADVETDVHLARSTALSTNAGVRLSIQALPGAAGSCTVVHTGPAHACRCLGGGRSQCSGNAQLLRLTEQRLSDGAALTTVNRSMLFDPTKGTVTPAGTLTIADSDGQAVRKIINILGRVRSCTPNGVRGFTACS